MKATAILVVLTILGSLCQGKPVNKKKKPGKVNDKPKQGKITTHDIKKMIFLKFLTLTLIYPPRLFTVVYRLCLSFGSGNN